ncbi:MAG: lamin tail domain-containing protein [Candidatus Pacebacteria bacterium]|nr:lamin tail domain-containing protein [Candidatus Paceibacterota bacterium]
MLILSRAVVVLLLFFITFTVLAADSPEIEKIDVNIAPLEDLLKIIHIGEVRAKELIFLRPFSSLDDLIRIKGIGEKNLKDIKEQGLAWVSEQPQTELAESVVEVNYQQTYPAGVVLNEILPSPEGPDVEQEWIEIFNQNNFKVDLSGWQIADSSGAVTNYTFPEGIIINPGEYLILPRPMTKITLNNDGDLIKLIKPNSEITDSAEYKNAPAAESFNRTEAGWFWSKNLTPGLENSIDSAVEKEEDSASPTTTEKELEKNTAAISQSLKNIEETENSNAYLVFFAALIFAFFSGIMILFLKNKLKKVDF